MRNVWHHLKNLKYIIINHSSITELSPQNYIQILDRQKFDLNNQRKMMIHIDI